MIKTFGFVRGQTVHQLLSPAALVRKWPQTVGEWRSVAMLRYLICKHRQQARFELELPIFDYLWPYQICSFVWRILTKLIREGQRRTNYGSLACALYAVAACFLGRLLHVPGGGEVCAPSFSPVGPEPCRKGHHDQSNEWHGRFHPGLARYLRKLVARYQESLDILE